MVNKISQFVVIISFLFSINLQAEEKLIDLASLKDINGQALKIEPATDKVFLYFWAYWCPECEDKFTNFFPQNLSKIKIPIITVNTDSKENKVRGFIEKHNLKLPILMDSDKQIRKLALINGVPGWTLLTKQKDGRYVIALSKTGFDESEVRKVLGLL